MKKADFRVFYEKHVDAVYRFVYFRAGSDRQTAEDLTSEIFLKALKAFSGYDPKKSETAWIHTIARNHLKNFYRDRKQTEDLDAHAFHLEGENEQDIVSRTDTANLVARAMRVLKKREQTVVEMKYLQGYKYKEIARALGRSAGSVRVEAHRAMKKMKAFLTPQQSRVKPTRAKENI